MAAGEDVDASRQPRLERRCIYQLFDHATNGRRPPILKCSLKVRRGHIDESDVAEFGVVGANELEKTFQVVALDLSHTGGTDADEFGLGATGDVEDGLLHVVKAAEDGSDLAQDRKSTRLNSSHL